MKAAVLNTSGSKFDIDEVQLAAPTGAEVVVEVKASGLCHSDLHMAELDYGVPLPAVFGHELSGIVVETGPDVVGLRIGDHVVGALIQFCGQCDPCINGTTYLCTRPETTLRTPDDPARISRDGAAVTQVFGLGGFAERALVHANQLVKIPDAIPFAQAALLGCGTITGAGAALNTAAVRVGDSVAVIGAGGVGLNVISGARLAGASRIIAVDTVASKETLARRFGATDFVNTAENSVIDAVRELSGGGVDHSFEVIGLNATCEQAVRVTRRGGTAYFIGMSRPNERFAVDVLGDLITNQICLKGVYMGSTNIKHDIPMYADLYLQGRFNLDDLLSQEIALDQINDAYAELKHGAVARSVITTF